MTYLVNTFDDYLINDFCSITIDEGYPGIDHVSFHSELNVYGFKHLDASDDIMKSLLFWLLATYLIH